MDWLLVILLAVPGPQGSVQTVEKREIVRSELACHTAIMRYMDTKGQQVVEAECLRPRAQRSASVDHRASMQSVRDQRVGMAPIERR